MIAAGWFVEQGASVLIPLFHTNRDYDFVVDWDGGIERVQVKTTTLFRKQRWDVTLCTRGGNRSWSGVVKLLDPQSYDCLFVVAGDGRRWLIPAAEVGGGTGIRLGGPKYQAFEIEPGTPLLALGESLDCAPAAGFRSGQTGRTVNPLALPSQVRILPPP